MKDCDIIGEPLTFVYWDCVVTNQGSRNMVARLNPIRKHIVMKTARLLGTHAITVTARMNGCWTCKQGQQDTITN